MSSSLHLRRGSWSVADQIVVSGGAFLVNLLLARHLPPVEYGTFAVLLGAMLTLQLVASALLLYPMSVRLHAAADAAERGLLLRATLLLVAVLAVALGAALGVVLVVLGRQDLALPALCGFVFWQVQEATRRGLMASFQHRAAMLGDVVAYGGQAAIVVTLSSIGGLTLAGAYYGMAAASCAAAAIQYIQLGMPMQGPLALRRVAAESWAIGGAWSLGNGLLSQFRIQVLSWVVAATGGMAAAAALQAAANIVNMANPLLISLGNIIPQTAAQARRQGNANAWRAARSYALLALPCFLGYAILVVTVPQSILIAFYGADSEYAGLTDVVRLLVVGALAGYAADIVVSFLHGVVELRLATRINAVGMLTVLVLAWPLVAQFGLTGACMVVIAANLARLAACRLAMTQVIGALGPRMPAVADTAP